MEIKSKSLLSSISFVAVCFVVVLLSLWVERALHLLRKFLKHKNQDALFEALQKLKEELMILGFISLLISVFQTKVSRICIPIHLAQQMTPCKSHEASKASALVKIDSRRLQSSEAAAASHCPKIRQWRSWEKSILKGSQSTTTETSSNNNMKSC